MARTYTLDELNAEINRLSEQRRACFQRLGAEFSDGRGIWSAEYQALRRQIGALDKDLARLYAEKRRILAKDYLQRELLQLPRYRPAA